LKKVCRTLFVPTTTTAAATTTTATSRTTCAIILSRTSKGEVKELRERKYLANAYGEQAIYFNG